MSSERLPRRGFIVAQCVALSTSAFLFGCPGSPGTDGGTRPPDICKSASEALTSAACALPLDGGSIQAYIVTKGEQHFYRMDLPGGLVPRTLLQIIGGYQAPSTPVELSLNVLPPDGGPSIALAADLHGQGAPNAIDLLFQETNSNTTLLLIASDGNPDPNSPGVDLRAPFAVSAALILDPDPNEGNDPNPTPITLTDVGGVLTGSNGGYLSTQNDVDLFSIHVPTQTSPRKILYVDVSAPLVSPPPAYILSYTLSTPDGGPLAADSVKNTFIPTDLATARLAPGGDYILAVQGFHKSGNTLPVPGDLRVHYSVNVEVLDEADVNEPNDTLATAKVMGTLPMNTPVTITGRLDHVPDDDWYDFTVPNSGSPTMIHFKMLPTATGGRFPPFPTNPQIDGGFGPVIANRQVRMFTLPGSATACNTPATCPKGDQGNPAVIQLEQQFCGLTPAQCIWSERDEQVFFDNLRNFEGIQPIAANSGLTHYYFQVRSSQSDFADDKDYALQVTWQSDPQPVKSGTVLLPADVPVNGGFPAPPSGDAIITGHISYGYGRLNQFDSTGEKQSGIRAARDYDAVLSDMDTYEIDLPGGLSQPYDRTWELQWTVPHAPDGGYVHDIGVDVTFCDPNQPTNGGPCGAGAMSVNTTSKGNPLTLLYRPDPLLSWHGTSANFQPLWTRTTSFADDTTTATAYQCACFEPRFVQGGKFFVTVSGVDRGSYDPVTYTIRSALTTYPQQYSLVPGSGTGNESCPAVVPDGGVDGGRSGGCFYTNEF